MKKPTRTKRAILARPRSELRRITLGEKLKRGLSLKGAYYVPKITKVTKRTAFVWQDAQLGISHGKAAKLRKAGRLGYGTRGEERAIPKSVLTRRRLAKLRSERAARRSRSFRTWPSERACDGHAGSRRGARRPLHSRSPSWSPFQRLNAGISWIQHPGDYANPIPTTPATAPKLIGVEH